jgi:hypothetical protein
MFSCAILDFTICIKMIMEYMFPEKVYPPQAVYKPHHESAYNASMCSADPKKLKYATIDRKTDLPQVQNTRV